ncbi:MAG: hypothetical protein QOG75_5958 [Mycobacterium sp.]|jgi:hypothetical protein|nr:hypothetical protein [Mycobacterium sp.]
MDQWTRYAQWHRPRLRAQDVARFFDMTVEVIEGDVAAGSVYFPAPQESAFDDGPRWSEYAVFSVIRQRYPHLAHRIPRLFPESEAVAAAQFVSARAVDLGRGALGVVGGQYAVHTWYPGDGGGAVAIAYHADSTPRPYDGAAQGHVAQALLHHLQVSAAIVPTPGQALVYADEPGSGGQPQVQVADRSSSTLSDWAWFDVVALLRVDVPWWPGGLADLDAMLAWQPGAEPQRVHPQANGAAAAWITKAGADGGAEATRRAFDAVAAWADYKLCRQWSLEPDGTAVWQDIRERPGLVRAAVPHVAGSLREPTDAELRRVLHHVVDDREVSAAATHTAAVTDLWSALIAGHVIVINRDACTKLVHEFCHRLEPVPAAHRRALGFGRIASFMGGIDVAPAQYWRDPYNPDMWIISDSQGTMYATIGYAVPAYGQLAELTVGHALDDRHGEQVVFFRDCHGRPWPMPTTRRGYYMCGGSDHGSANELTSSVLTLLEDAAADTRNVGLDDIAGTALQHYFATTPPPIHISGHDLAAMRGSR